MKQKFSSPVIRALKYYVYIYSHPITKEVFYVGKGKGNRVFSHIDEESDSNKTAYLSDLKAQGLEPRIEILIHGLQDEEMALRVEASIIDLIGMNQLTNRQSGYKSGVYGRMSLEQINALYDGQTIDILEPTLLIRINQAFRYSMSEIELYDYTRGQWKLNRERASEAKYAMAVYQGIVQEVYQIHEWYDAGATFSVRRDNRNIKRSAYKRMDGRYEFIGNLAKENTRKKIPV